MIRHAALLAAFVTSATSAAVAAPSLPAPQPPAGIRAVDDRSGGRILEGSLGRVGAPAVAFSEGLRRANRYFGNTMELANVVRRKDGRTMMGFLRARLGGTPVSGLAITSVDARGNGRVSILVDAAQRFPRSVSSLADHLQRLQPAVAAGGPSVPVATSAMHLHAVSAQDGTVSAQIPDGWRVIRLSEGQFLTSGPSDEEVLSGVSIPFVDPRGQAAQQKAQMESGGLHVPSIGLPMMYSTDDGRTFTLTMQRVAAASHQPVPNVHLDVVKTLRTTEQQGFTLRAVEIAGTAETAGKTMRFDDVATFLVPGPTGVWSMGLSGIGARAERFAALAPQLIAIMNTYRFNTSARIGQVQHNIDEGRAIANQGWATIQRNIVAGQQQTAINQAKVDASMASARSVQDGIDRSTAGFVNYLRGTDVVRNTATGNQATMSQSASDALTHFDPQHFESVPVSQYVKGVNY